MTGNDLRLVLAGIFTNWHRSDALQLAVAIGTIGLALVTLFLVVKTGDMAGATRQVIFETQKDWDLAWRPQLDLSACEPIDEGDDTDTCFLKIFNAGGGPAIATRVLLQRSDPDRAWWIWSPGDVVNWSSSQIQMGAHTDACPNDLFAPPVRARFLRTPDAVLYCADILGTRFRCLIVNVFEQNEPRVRVNPKEQWRSYPAESVRSDQENDRPTWADHPWLWSD
jgi:hypothetical protein